MAAGSQISEGASSNVGSNPGSPVGSTAGSPSGKPTSSGSFTNLQNYLNANADQSEGLGGKISQNVQSEANQGVSGLNDSVKSFKSDTDTAADGINADTANTVKDTFNKALTDPTSLQDSDYTTVNNIYGANGQTGLGADYASNEDSGPKDLTGYDSYNNSVAKLQSASNDAQNLGTESGRQELLNQAYARPDYGQGQQQLDQLLLQGSAANAKNFQTIQNNLLGTDVNNPTLPQSVDYTTYTGPSSTLAGQEAAAQQAANDYRTQTASNVNNAYTTIQDYLNGNGGASPLSVTAPTVVTTQQTPTNNDGRHSGATVIGNQSPYSATSVIQPGSVDISGNGLLGYGAQLAQQEVDAANQNQQAAYNQQLNSLYNQLAPYEASQYSNFQSARPGFVNGVRNTSGGSPNYTTLDQLRQQVANTGANQANLSNAVDPNTLAMINALNKLAGNNLTNTVTTDTGQQTVGSGYTQANPFDQAAALARQQAAYNQYVSSLPS